MKEESGVKWDRAEASTFRVMRNFDVTEMKRNAEIRELLGTGTSQFCYQEK